MQADPDQRNDEGITPMRVAVDKHIVAAVEKLYEASADIVCGLVAF